MHQEKSGNPARNCFSDARRRKIKKKKKTVGSLLSNLGPAELKLENVRQLRRDVGVQGPCQVPGLHDPVVVEIAGKNT
jgi:hypothetical protein